MPTVIQIEYKAMPMQTGKAKELCGSRLEVRMMTHEGRRLKKNKERMGSGSSVAGWLNGGITSVTQAG